MFTDLKLLNGSVLYLLFYNLKSNLFLFNSLQACLDILFRYSHLCPDTLWATAVVLYGGQRCLDRWPWVL